MITSADETFMRLALTEANKAEAVGEVPVGALVVKEDQVIASGYNRPIAQHDPSAHAEIVALRAAGEALNNYRLLGVDVYVTLEPCAMCLTAMIHARVRRIVFAAPDPKAGALGGAFSLLDIHHFNHAPEYVGGILSDASAQLLRAFFSARR